MDTRYIENIGTLIDNNLQNKLLQMTIGVIGCGGNGGYMAEFLARLGVKKLILFDGDKFELSNINRQIYYNKSKNKAKEAKKRIKKINNTIIVKAYPYFWNKKYIKHLLKCDIVISCIDSPQYFKDYYELLKYNIPILINSNMPKGLQCSIYDKKHIENFQNFIDTIQLLLDNKIQVTGSSQISQPAFVCAMSASFACLLLIQYLKNEIDIGKIYHYYVTL